MRKIILLLFLLTCQVKNIVISQQWSPVGAGMGNVPYYGEAWVNSLAMYNGELYAGGVFDSAGGIPVNRIAKWNGTNWGPVGEGVILNGGYYGGYSGHVRTMIIHGGELYVGGFFDSAGGIAAKNIAKWNGTNWSPVGTGVNNVVIDFAIFNGDLYAGGSFDTAGGVATNRIAKWNGTTWAPVGDGIDLDWFGDHPTSVYALAVNNGILYAGGAFDTAGTVPANNIAKWDGASWSALSSGVAYGTIYSLASYNGEIYAGGDFGLAGGVYASSIAKWNGINWSALGSGTDGGVYSMSVYNNVLYIGGGFWTAGNVPANRIAKWNGTNWSGVGQGVNSYVFELFAADSSLYIGGHFTYADTLSANRIVKWTGNCLDPLQPGTISGNDTVCAGSIQTYFIDPVAGATSYTWALPMGWPGSSNTNTITTIPYYDGEFSISVWANNSCGNSPIQTKIIRAFPAPPPLENIVGSATVCSGSTQTYSVNPIPGISNYSWTLPAGWTGNSTTNSITTIAGANGGNISVTINNVCGSSPTQTLTVAVISMLPQPATIIGNSSVCQGSTQTYSISTVSGATNYTWTLPAGWTGNSVTNSISVIVGAIGGDISVSANNTCGTSLPQNLTIAVNSVPTQPGTIYGMSSSVCEGSSQTYSINTISGVTSYTWILPPVWTGNSTTNSITAVAGANSGNISVTANNSCGSSSPQTLAVTANPLPPTPDPISGNIFVCENSIQTYSIPPVSGASDYTWTLPPGWTGSSFSNSITVFAGSNSGNVSVRANSNCGNSLDQDLHVSIFPDTVPPIPQLISGNMFVFSGQKENYSVSNINGVTKYSWSVSGGGVIIQGQNSNSISVNWQASGNYILSVKVSNNCNTSEEQKIYITVFDPDTRDPFEIKVIPNPSSGEFYLKAKRIQDKVIKVEVMNMSGQVVYKKSNLQGTNNYSQLLNLSMLAQGLYIVKIVVDEKVYIRKIVINR